MPARSVISARCNWLQTIHAFLAMALLAPAHDAGAQSAWEMLPTGSAASLRGLSVVDDRVIWASGTRGTILRTADGGATWATDSVPGAARFDLRGIHGRSGRVAHVAATAGRIWRTTDGGRTWSLRYQSPDTSMFLDAIVFTDDRIGFALGDPIGGLFVLLVTTDGGDTWREADPRSRPAAARGEAAFAASGTSLVFLGSRHAWIGTGGEHSRVLGSTDAATTWSGAPSAIPPRAGSGGVFSLAFADTLNGIAVGGDYERPDSSAGTASFTADGGRTWIPAIRPPRGYRSGVAVHVAGGRLLAIAVGPNGTDISHDGGKTWSPLDGTGFNAVQFAPSGAAFAVGARGRVGRYRGP